MLDEQLLRAVDRNHLMAYDECTVTPCQHSSMGESDGRINIPGTMSCPTLLLAAPCPRATVLRVPPLCSLAPYPLSPLSDTKARGKRKS